MLSASHLSFLTILVAFRIIGYTGNIFKTPRLLTTACIPAYTFALNCHCSFYSANNIWSCLFSPINKTNKQQTNTWLYEYVIALSATHSCFHIKWLPSSMVAIPGPVLSAKLSRWNHSSCPQSNPSEFTTPNQWWIYYFSFCLQILLHQSPKISKTCQYFRAYVPPCS